MEPNITALRSVTEHFYLAFTAWREARGESDLCIAAVCHSILNRVARPKWWGHTIDEVTTKKWQYSSLTDPKDPQLTKWPTMGDASWIRCLEIARLVMAGQIVNPVPGADSYYDTSISAPNWTATARQCGQIGRIIFWDVDNDFQEVT